MCPFTNKHHATRKKGQGLNGHNDCVQGGKMWEEYNESRQPGTRNLTMIPEGLANPEKTFENPSTCQPSKSDQQEQQRKQCK